VFLTRQMPSYGVKAAKMLIANTPFGLLASRALAKPNRCAVPNTLFRLPKL